jgi:hypothetical protein
MSGSSRQASSQRQKAQQRHVLLAQESTDFESSVTSRLLERGTSAFEFTS